MALNDSDFLQWYNDEITRYRNIEWKLAGYSIGFSYGLVLLGNNPITKKILPDSSILAIFLAVFVLSLIGSELHIHSRLNEFRAKRKALLNGEKKHFDTNASFWENLDIRDNIYLLAFILFPLIIGIFSFLTLWSNSLWFHPNP